MASPEAKGREKLTMFQRMAMRELRRRAEREDGEPLEPEDWEVMWRMHEDHRFLAWFFRTLPSSPRCGVCGAPFAGPGRLVASPLGYRPSRKNPTICSMCVELSPPGGTSMYTGVLFADLRGFTARSAGADAREVSQLLRRFYRCAEDVLFPHAMIDKVVGDEVMAIYLPDLHAYGRDEAPAVMLEHARGLLHAVGYGSADGPFAELGIGLDIGEAFVGNIGQRALYDFTAVGDVVNTASRLQGQAAGGEIVVSQRVADGIPGLDAPREELALKGKPLPEPAYRIRV
jgi:adenylate cyclase